MAAQNRNCKVKRLALMGLLFALAMALSFLESLLPALPMLPPGIRLGLSNIVTMYALFVLGKSLVLKLSHRPTRFTCPLVPFIAAGFIPAYFI